MNDTPKPLTCEDVGCPCVDALTEEDPSDAALESSDDLTRSMTLIERAAAAETLALKDNRIEDEAGLMRAFASLRRATRALAQNQRMQAPVLEEARRELADLEARCAKANAALEARAEHHRNRIEVYARTHRDELVQGKRKTRDFGIGSVSFRTTGGEYRWRKDMPAKEREAALLPWASGRRGCTRSVEVVDLAEVKKYLAWAREEAKNNSEEPPTPPGLEYVPEHEELTVKVEGDK